MANINLIYRIDIGFSEDRGYACAIFDVSRPDNPRQKGIRGNSIEQIASRLRHVLIQEENKRTHFPLESEPARIITPNGFNT